MKRGAIDDAYLREGFTKSNFDLLQIKGVEESETEWILGRIHVDKRDPSFRWGYGAGLSKTSRFRLQSFQLDDIGRAGVAAIFHQFDEEEHGKPTAEYFAGWVSPDEEPKLAEWVSFMNAEIGKRLAGAT
jgi:hypothetical protein